MLIVTCIIIALSACECARILGVIPTPSFSHQVVFQPLWKELSLRGHQVTVLTTDPINDLNLTNLTEIDISFSYKVLHDNLLEIINASQNPLKVIDLTIQTFNNVTDQQLHYPPVRNLIDDPTQEFDLLIVEYTMPAMVFFAKRFQCPHIGVMSLDPPSIVYDMIGNPTHPILYPDILLALSDQLTLFERVVSVLYEILIKILLAGRNDGLYSIVYKHFGYQVDDLEFVKNASLLFINSDTVFDKVRPLVPAVIQIGGPIARIPMKSLQEDIKYVLDNAKDGFIYFSLGSNVKSKDLPLEIINVILKTFEELPYKILWKYEDADLPNLPSNVVISKWVAQKDVLRHTNLKLFITHGGAQSMEEAVYAKVPMVGMAIFVDQFHNVQKMVSRGFALSVNYRELEKENFKQTILEVINNPKYRNRVVELAELAEDQPMTGLERAVWWTEYVLRHKGAAHLRSPVLDIPWYQYYLIDVIAVILCTITVLIYLIVMFAKCLFRLLKFIVPNRMKLKQQ